MEFFMIKNNEELEEHLSKWCREKNKDINIFEIARMGKSEGAGDRKVLYGSTTVRNKNCTYVIKLFIKHDIIIIWNYRNNPAMSYSYMTINEKLQNGVCIADKGRGTHTNKQSIILFEHSENFERLLNKIADII